MKASYHQNITIAIDSLNMLTEAKEALSVVTAKMKYKDDLLAIKDVLEMAEVNMELALDNLNNLKEHTQELEKEIEYWKVAYGHSLDDSITISEILSDKVKEIADKKSRSYERIS